MLLVMVWCGYSVYDWNMRLSECCLIGRLMCCVLLKNMWLLSWMWLLDGCLRLVIVCSSVVLLFFDVLSRYMILLVFSLNDMFLRIGLVL